jgi:hypothetical protein
MGKSPESKSGSPADETTSKYVTPEDKAFFSAQMRKPNIDMAIITKTEDGQVTASGALDFSSPTMEADTALLNEKIRIGQDAVAARGPAKGNTKAYRDNFEQIFRKKDEDLD